MKKFKQYYKAITNPQTAVDFKILWDNELEPYSGKAITAEQQDLLWKLSVAAIKYRASHMDYTLFDLGNCWFTVHDNGAAYHNLVMYRLSKADYQRTESKARYWNYPIDREKP